MTTRRPLFALALATALSGALSVAPGTALADATDQARTEQARALFNAGAVAYKAGDFRAAIQAFKQAYAAEPRPGVLFSIGQAQRRQYAVDRVPARAVEALRIYREYLAKVDQGGRRLDAAEAVAEMEPIVARLTADGVVTGTLDDDRATRLVISCPVEGAVFLLDNESKQRPVAQVIALSPGKHTIRVQADGYAEERRELEIASGSVTAIDMPLRELPAALTLTARKGAEVTIDGRPVGSAPFAAPVEVTPGKHTLRFTAPGYGEYEETLDVRRAGARSIVATMPRTTQRTAAWGLIYGGGATAVIGGIVGIVAAAKQGDASSLKASIDTGSLHCPGTGCQTLNDYNSAVQTRDQLRYAAGALAGIGVVAAASGALLYFFDEPSKRRGPATDEAGPLEPKPALPVDISGVIAPGVVSLALRGTF